MNLPGRSRAKFSAGCKNGPISMGTTRRDQTSQSYRPPMVPTPITAWRHQRRQIGSLCLTTQTWAKTKEAYVYVRTHAHKLLTDTHLLIYFDKTEIEPVGTNRLLQEGNALRLTFDLRPLTVRLTYCSLSHSASPSLTSFPLSFAPSPQEAPSLTKW